MDNEVKINLSDAVSIEKIIELSSEFIDPYQNKISEILEMNGGVVPLRRVLGNYLTFFVIDISKNHSVIIKKDMEPDSFQCDCIDFIKKNQCKHVATVLYSLKKTVETEIEVEREELLKIEKIRKQETAKEKEKLEKINHIDAVQKPKKSIEPVNNNSNNMANYSPYIYPYANNFSISKFYHHIPDIYSTNTRNKKFGYRVNPVNKGVDVEVKYFSELNSIKFCVTDQNEISITCTCKTHTAKVPCSHIKDAIVYLTGRVDSSMFKQFLNADIEKNKLLSEFGLNIKDEEAKEFSFKSDYYGNMVLDKIPSHFVAISKVESIKSKILSDSQNKDIKPVISFRKNEEEFEIGLVFHLTNVENTNGPIRIDAFKAEKLKKGDFKIKRILIGNTENIPLLSKLETKKFDALMDFSYLKFQNFISSDHYYSATFHNFTQYFNKATRKSYLNYFWPKLDEHWYELSEWSQIKYLPEGSIFHKSNLEDISLSNEKLVPYVKAFTSQKFINIEIYLTNNNNDVLRIDGDGHIFLGRLFLKNNILYRINIDDMEGLLEAFPNGKLLFPIQIKDKVIREILHPISKLVMADITNDLKLQVKEVEMVPAIHLREYEDKFLLVEPRFYYDDLILDTNSPQDISLDENGEKMMLVRDFDKEHAFVEYVKSLHPNFKLQVNNIYFQLPFDEVMKNQWFINMSKQLMTDDVKLVGFHDLKKFKYNNTVPKWDMSISSGIDWFDINIKATWGDQSLSFKDIRKAIMNQQDFVVLGDGSFGMLPEEWLTKYSYLFKFGIEEKEGVKVSKKHFSIVDMLFDQIDNEAVIAEIEQKKRTLMRIETIEPKPIPSNILATLRPYQETGYQWMQVLDEISWGGCLADDMGLGKTLQTITFLSFLKSKYKNPTSLIICPTSLIFNWEAELKRFAPELKYHIFYGLGRTFSKDHFNDYDIIISSYGIVRNDIETLVKFNWEYVILDESQAIKNPDAIATKAVQLLKARNRLILSGTPLQNNTFDIFAQFNFLNPGLLGGKDFFKREFAQPIDKNGNKDASELLRKLLKPFMLRRTKSEVAPDLPEKTEMILWCQMEKAQKNLYNEYKDYYRHALVQKIEEEGMAKAGIYILEGLLRLRQICDDPRLIKDQEVKPSPGIKIQELMREITENMGNHKMLVFSQFTEMLALIKAEFDTQNIKYCYLDGSTPAAKRKEAVEEFQTNKSINVFLISLKAGGVGLNLTEADYVYIFDPWWNPAVEQQAIDRTHRIGQVNKIFAYKMICKDSVEEKIIQLQEKKLSISKEIVQEDSAFFKSLTKDDISFLFS